MVVGKDRNSSDQIKSYLSLLGRAACLRVSPLPLYFTIFCPGHLSLQGKEPLEIVKKQKKCTCALVSHAVLLLSTILYKRAVPAVRTTPSASERPREHVPEAASSQQQQQQHVAEGGLVSPTCCSAVSVKRRTESSVFDISPSSDILRHSAG